MISASPNAVESPCIQVCSLDSKGMCQGCYRTQEEIMLWTRLTHEGQSEVLRRCKTRAQAAGSKSTA